MSHELTLPRHQGTRNNQLKQWQQTARAAANSAPSHRSKILDAAVDLICDKNNLRLAWDHAKTHGGQAAGPNGKSFGDYTRVASWEEIDRLQDQLRNDQYRHGSVRRHPIPKRPGDSGTRTLSIPDIQDRVVARTVVQIVEPLVSPLLSPQSFCRPGLGPHRALAFAKSMVEQEDRCIWICEDIRCAFDEVPLEHLFQVCERYLPSDRLNQLIRRCVDDRRDWGLYQGSPLSPLLMNLDLDHGIDGPWREMHCDVPQARYMDDFVIFCGPWEEDNVWRLHGDLADLVGRLQLRLKHGAECAIVDLQQRDATWLGYRLRKGPAGMEIRLPFGVGRRRGTWNKYLKHRFKKLWEEPNAPVAARAMIQGIIAWAGPALPWTKTRGVYELLRRAARSAAIEEIPSYSAIQQHWQEAYDKWLSLVAGGSSSETLDWLDQDVDSRLASDALCDVPF